ncbi:MAG: SbmA/BacA-like family transporter [Bradyrhizobium sp.]
MAIFFASIAVTTANMFGQVELNDWNGRFFDAVGRKDLSGFVHDIWTFLVIIAVLLALTVANTFLQERLKVRLREWITRHLLAEWLKPLRVYQLSFAGEYGRNPDQRMQEDTRLLGDYTADLGCGMVYSLLQIVAFVGVLWALSAQVVFQVAGYDIAIPGYMVWCALAYASIGSGLTWLVGRPLIALNGERYAREAEFRFALVRVNESGESIACMAERRTNNDISKPRSRPSWTPCGGSPPRSPTSPGSHRARAGCRSSFRYSWPRRPISAAA